MKFDPYTNPLLMTDYYNFKHGRMKCNVDWEVSHMYNRNKPMILFGLNWTVLNLLTIKIEQWMIDEAVRLYGARFPADLFQRVIKECAGYIPLRVEALPDGSWVPKGCAFAQISNTEKGFGELVTWWEGAFMHAYFPANCATEAFKMRRYLNEKKLSPWRIHSFGWRAQRSNDDAVLANMGWHLSLPGADDVIAKRWLPSEIPTGSIPASAHKTAQQFDDELEAYKRQVDVMAEDEEPMYSMVIDTYDAYRFIDKHMEPVLKHALTKKGFEKIVFRPDSGDTLDQRHKVWQKAVELGLEKYTGTIDGNDQDFERIKQDDKQMEEWGMPLDAHAYGVGSGFFQKFSRDTLGWAMKTAYSNGKDRMKLAQGKHSIPGVVNVWLQEGKYFMGTVSETFDTAYRVIYEYEHTDTAIHINTHEDTLSEIYARVQESQAIPELQEEIILTPALQAKIDAIIRERQ